jgi:hypothetical protein
MRLAIDASKNSWLSCRCPPCGGERREVDRLGHVVGRRGGALAADRRVGGRDHGLQEFDDVAEMVLAREHAAVSGDEGRELEKRHRLERANPLGRIAAEGVRNGRVDEIAGYQYLLRRQIGHDVAPRVAPSQELELHLPIPEVDRELVVERERRGCEDEAAELAGGPLLQRQILHRLRLFGGGKGFAGRVETGGPRHLRDRLAACRIRNRPRRSAPRRTVRAQPSSPAFRCARRWPPSETHSDRKRCRRYDRNANAY